MDNLSRSNNRRTGSGTSGWSGSSAPQRWDSLGPEAADSRLQSEDRWRRAKRMATYLRNEMQGWEAMMSEQRDLASALAIVLVLLATIQYTGMLTPPLGYITVSDVVGGGSSNSTQTEPLMTSQKQAVLAFVVFNALGFALSTVALLAVLSTTMITSVRGAVNKAVDTFCAYVSDASAANFNEEKDGNPVSITYRRAVAKNFKVTMESKTMRWRLGSLEMIRDRECIKFLGLEYRDGELHLPDLPPIEEAGSLTDELRQVAQGAAAPLVYWQLFSAVHDFFWLCLPCELEKHTKLVCLFVIS